VAKKNVWTVPHPDGGWANKLEGSSRFLKPCADQARGPGAGPRARDEEQVEHIIQNKDGQIGQRNSYGHDPRNVPG
jgi:hypothetical protein